MGQFPGNRLYDQVTAGVRGGTARRWDSFRVGDDSSRTRPTAATTESPGSDFRVWGVTRPVVSTFLDIPRINGVRSRKSTGRCAFDKEAILERLHALHAQREAKIQEVRSATKAQVAAGDSGPPNETVRRLMKELRKLHADCLRQIRLLQRAHGISEAEIRAIERARESEALPSGDEFWRTQVEETQATDDLDASAQSGIERLIGQIDPEWLRAEGQKPYRLGTEFLNNPLHLVNGVRVGMGEEAAGPQRLARMLLVSQDHLMKRWDLDFFAAATYVPEVAVLGNSLDEIRELGPAAEEKLANLPSMTDDNVGATVFELLVGAACVRRGLDVTMVPEDRSRKVPDYQITGLGPIPGAVECKRRLGLSSYELNEAKRVEELYNAIRLPLHERGIHGSIEASFRVPLRSVTRGEFVAQVLAAVGHYRDQEPTPTSWGSLAFRRLAYCGRIPATRLYSPEYLERVFDSTRLQDEWDGLLCEVETPLQINVNAFRMPLCLKWRSESEEALTKKARGVTSLWGNAVKQIPDGEIGFIYIAYPEGARPGLADARTRHILKATSEWWHRWVRVPVTVIIRLYARPLGPGCPDLIESSLPGASRGQEFWLTKLPWRVFTGQVFRSPAA